MIEKEHPLALSDDERDCTLYLVPAAGRLGVIEEECVALHDEDSLTEDGIPFPCPACRAAV